MSDWATRETVEAIRLNIQRLVFILNELDHNARSHLALLDQRLDSVDRQVEQLESAVDHHRTS